MLASLEPALALAEAHDVTLAHSRYGQGPSVRSPQWPDDRVSSMAGLPQTREHFPCLGDARALRPGALAASATARDCKPKRPYRDQSGYSSLRQARGSSGSGFGVRSSRNEWYGATNGSGAITV